MPTSVREYYELLNISQTRNRLLNAMYLINDIGDSILQMPYYTSVELDEQKQLFLKLLADVANLVSNNSDLLKESDTDDAPPKDTNISFVKSADGVMHWVGSPTNKFEDKHRHILMEKAHLAFVEKLEKGVVPYPPLLLWHEDNWRVGETEWVAYDDRGFLVAGGTVYPQYESLMMDLQKEALGMSHRMPMSTVKFEQLATEKYLGIAEYISNEFTVLPVGEAANELTNWGT